MAIVFPLRRCAIIFAALFAELASTPNTMAAPPKPKTESAAARESAPATAIAAAAAADLESLSSSELRLRLIESLRSDLAAVRKAGGSGKESPRPSLSTSTMASSLASALNALTVGVASSRTPYLDVVTSQSSEGWVGSVQAYGSDKSAALVLRLVERLGEEQTEGEKVLEAKVEEVAQRCAGKVFEARTAADLDAILAELDSIGGFPERVYGRGANAQRLTTLRHFIVQWQNHLSHREAGRMVEALAALNNLNEREGIAWIPRSKLIAEVRNSAKACGRLTPEESAEKIAELMDKALSANTAAEVDAPLAEIKRQQRLAENTGADSGNLSYRFRSAATFMERWQEFVAAPTARAAGSRRDTLAQLTQNSDQYSDIPRSKLAERLAELEAKAGTGNEVATGASTAKAQVAPPEVIISQMKTLDDIESRLEALRSAIKPQPGNSPSTEWNSAMSELQAISRDYRQIKSGQSARVSMTSSYSGGKADSTIAELRRQLGLLAVGRFIGDDLSLPPKSEENVIAYLRRLLDQARERKDWRTLQRILDAAQSANVQDAVVKNTDATAIASFLAGITQEQAKQFAQAVASYQAALKTGSALIPTDEIGTRLAAIEKANPAAYQQGVDWAMHPPQPRVDPFGRPTGAYESRFGPSSGRPTGAVATPAPTITIPAKPQPAPSNSATPPVREPTKPAEPPAAKES